MNKNEIFKISGVSLVNVANFSLFAQGNLAKRLLLQQILWADFYSLHRSCESRTSCLNRADKKAHFVRASTAHNKSVIYDNKIFLNMK